MCQPVINPAGRVRELSPSSPVVPSGAPQFGSWLPSPLPSRELAPGTGERGGIFDHARAELAYGTV